jgi:hypothetical protein
MKLLQKMPWRMLTSVHQPQPQRLRFTDSNKDKDDKDEDEEKKVEVEEERRGEVEMTAGEEKKRRKFPGRSHPICNCNRRASASEFE